MDTTQLFCSILLSAIGLGYFVYGKRQSRAVPLLCGLGLMLFPYFVGNWILLLSLGAVMIALPIVIR